MKISIVVPTIQRNSLLTLLASLHGQDYHELIIINDHDKNRSKARNIGAKASTGDIILFLDDDVVVAPDFITHLKRFFHTCDCDIMQANISGGIETSLTHMFVTAGLAIRREVWEGSLGFDTKLTAHEDLDFCWRALDDEFTAGFCRNAKVYHPGPQGTVYTREQNKAMLKKHPRRFKALEAKNNSWIE